MKIIIPIAEIYELNEKRRFINSLNLKDIVFTDADEQPIEISNKIREEFQVTGLLNTDFITTGFYEEGFKEKVTENPEDNRIFDGNGKELEVYDVIESFLKNVDRIEVITEKGRVFSERNANARMQLQDDDRTLKIFTY